MSDSKIIYALIGKGAIPLVQYSSFTGTFDQYCINYLINVGPGTSAAVKSGDYIIYYINSNNITYLLMTYNTYPKEAAIGCLDSIKKEFTNTYSSTDSFNEKFCLQEQFKDKLRMKYDYFNANKDVSNESIGELKEQMNKMNRNDLPPLFFGNNPDEKMMSNTYSTSFHTSNKKKDITLPDAINQQIQRKKLYVEEETENIDIKNKKKKNEGHESKINENE